MRCATRPFFTFISLLLVAFGTASAQDKPAAKSNTWLQKKYSLYHSEAALNHEHWFAHMGTDMQLAADTEMRIDQVIEGAQSGMSHYKYKQYHAGLPVFGCTYTLHEDNGKVVSASGHFAPNIALRTTKPTLGADAAVVLAKQKMKAVNYSNKQKTPVLCLIEPGFPKPSGAEVRLAWMTDLTSERPFKKYRFFIDASNGKVLASWSLVHEQGVPSIAQTGYYGTRQIVTDSLGPQSFVLHDSTRAITVQNGSLQENFTSTTSNWNLTSANKDEAALDAHFCTQEYYDMMLNDYQWHGVDGQGGPLKVLIHQNQASAVNAYWDGEDSNYGDGNCIYGPLTTLEIVGHEFTHGMVDYTSGLIYDSESGAINESLSDMFGKMLEYNTDPTHFSWDLGHSFALTPDAEPFRVMDDPKSVRMPAFYQGEYWNADADVHTNSSIGNLWFVMLCDGRQGVNELNQPYNVPAIGFEKVGQIVFETNRAYLSENSNYVAFCTFSTEVAVQKYGATSVEANAVREAWKAVGVTAITGGGLDLKIVNSFWFPSISCDVNTYLPIKVIIENISDVDYNPTTSNKANLLLLSVAAPDKTVSVDMPIPAGGVIEVPINDWIFATEPMTVSIRIELDFQDAVVSNNVGEGYYYVLEPQWNDVLLHPIHVILENCFDDSLRFFAFLSNASCYPIASGTKFSLEIRDENNQIVSLIEDTITTNLEPFEGHFIMGQLPIGLNNNITATLFFAADPKMDNNETTADLPSSLPIVSDYLNTFTNDPSLDPYLSFGGFGSDNALYYQGNQMLAATGFFDDTSDVVRCPKLEDIIKDEYAFGFLHDIKTCLDFSTSATPQLEFDLAQFRNNLVDPNDLYSSMLILKWNGSHSGQEVIYGQQEGVKQHRTYALPSNFRGQLDLEFYTEIGEFFDLSNSNLSIHDFQLFDNLQFKGITSVINEPGATVQLRLAPNPAQELVSITSNITIESVRVSDMQGRVVLDRQLQAAACRTEEAVSFLPNGIYLLTAQVRDADGQVHKAVEKLVVLRI
jgi:Zn-dependent metalloprotease